MAHEDWTTIRVRKSRRAEAEAAAKAAGVSVAVWADRAMGRELARTPNQIAELRAAIAEAEAGPSPRCVRLLSAAVKAMEA